MAQDVTIAGASYTDVPAIEVPKTAGSGNALFLDADSFYTKTETDELLGDKVDTSDYSPNSKTSSMTQEVGKDSNGKLWTAPGGKGDKGDTGDSGVRVQSEQPTDPNVNVWIDTDGDSGIIQKSDLAQGVQDSLELADTALQGALLGGASGTQATIDANGNVIIPISSYTSAGVIRSDTSYGTNISTGGVLRAGIRTTAQYANDVNYLFIGKGTLENIKTNLVNRAMLGNVKTTMDAVAVADARYFLGEQSAVAISMPTDALVGQEILVCFSSGATACTLTCDLTGFSFVPKSNKTSWLKFTLYHKADASVAGDTDKWLVETKEG